MNVGRDLIGRVTDAVIEDVRAWHQRPLDDVYQPVAAVRAVTVRRFTLGYSTRDSTRSRGAVTRNGSDL